MKCRFLTFVLLASVTACDDSEATNILSLSATGTQLGGQVEVQVSQPGHNTTFTNAQFLANGSRVSVPAGKSGKMQVQFTVTASSTDTVATGKIEFDLHKGYIYSADLTRQRGGSGWTCIGCTGYQKFPLRGSQRTMTDSIWIYYYAAPPLCKGCIS